MAVTVEQLARQLIACVDTDAGYLLAAQWLVKRYEQLAVRTKFRHLRQVGQVSTVASLTTGTVTINRGQRIITGDATATAAWSSALVGRHIRLRVNWYEIVGYAVSGGFGTLELQNTFEEDDVAAGSYTAVLRWVPLDANAFYIGNDFIHPRRRQALTLHDYMELDRLAPNRPLISGGPGVVVEAPELPDGRKRVEFYPYSSTSENYFYVYWKAVASLGLQDAVPSRMPGYALIEALYPKRDLDELSRFALSVGLSLAVVPLAGLVLNFTPFGIRLLPVALSIAGITVSFMMVALLRKHAYYKLAKGIF